ncbi:MAG: three-Cys-motif partner protein TcmP [Pseudomonadota bacterium]
MLDASAYEGREQTYVKHFVLEKYLERVAYNILSFSNEFVYVDGFSGPWKSKADRFEDTSFHIATETLREIRDGLKQPPRRKNVSCRCMFIEKEAKPYADLSKVVGEIKDIPIELIHGSFEDNVQKICDFVGQKFSLIFIDPTGWQGFPLDKITPLLNLRGEVLINFMSDFINRFLEDPRPEIAATFNALFGDEWFDEWKLLTEGGLSREAAAIEVYKRRLKQAGNFEYVTSTRILKPTADRSYFYLIYGTRHWKGIQEFRAVEKKTVDEQERVRNAAKYESRVASSGQESMFGREVMEFSNKSYQDERETQLQRGRDSLDKVLSEHPKGILYENLLGHVLETPLVWESDLKTWIAEKRKLREISIPDWTARQRLPKKGNTIVPK